MVATKWRKRIVRTIAWVFVLGPWVWIMVPEFKKMTLDKVVIGSLVAICVVCWVAMLIIAVGGEGLFQLKRK